MTNREKYKQAFSAIHASDKISLEVLKMKSIGKKQKFKTLVASVAVCAAVAVSAAAVYAADIGGIQRIVQLWIHGDQTEATITFDGSGNYDMNYTDGNGDVKHQGGGGVAVAPDGSERPASEEELMEQLTAPDVRYEDNGSVKVYWFDKVIEITDKFKNEICYVKLVNGEKTLYMTVKYKNGYATSPKKYISPQEFN